MFHTLGNVTRGFGSWSGVRVGLGFELGSGVWVVLGLGLGSRLGDFACCVWGTPRAHLDGVGLLLTFQPPSEKPDCAGPTGARGPPLFLSLLFFCLLISSRSLISRMMLANFASVLLDRLVKKTLSAVYAPAWTPAQQGARWCPYSEDSLRRGGLSEQEGFGKHPLAPGPGSP